MKILPLSTKGTQDGAVSVKLEDADRISLIRLEGKAIKIIEDREQANVHIPAKVMLANLIVKSDELTKELQAIYDSLEGNGTQRMKDIGLEEQQAVSQSEINSQ